MSKILTRTKPFEISGINPFKKIHGHTKIELTDIRDGSKKIIEHDNAFQPGVLASYMRSLGAVNNNPYDNDTWNSQAKWRNLVGGILLFRDAIDNSNGEVEYMPDGNQMTANGAYRVVNSGQPVEMGSWNEVESVIGSDSIVMVYDWDTSHGNGTIGCISLTSETGGYIGYGNPSGQAASNRLLSTNQNYRIKDIIYKGNEYIPSSSGITIRKICIDEGSIFDGIERFISHAFTNNHFIIDQENGKIVMFREDSAERWYAGNTITLEIFDCNTETFSSLTLTNTTGGELRISYCICSDNAIWYPTAPAQSWNDPINPYHAFSLSDGTYLGARDFHNTESPYYGKITPELDCYGSRYNNMRIKTDSTSDSSWKITNGIMNNSSDRSTNYTYIEYYDAIMICSGYFGSDKKTYMFKNPLYLATVNNLATPVTKNNTQTMKVTYTLTEG